MLRKTEKIFSLLCILLVLFFNSCFEKPKKETIGEEYVCATSPLIQEGEDTLDFARKVMEFVVENANYGYLPNHLTDTFFKIPFEHFPVDKFIKLFQKNEIITTCGLSSIIFSKILDYKVNNSYTYNIGLENTDFTHVVSLVKINNELIVLDSYLNCEYLNPNTKTNIDIFNFVSIVIDGIQPLKSCNISKSDFLVTTINNNDLIGKNDSCLIWALNFEEKNNIMMCLECGQKTPCYDMINEFEKEYLNFYEIPFFEMAFLDKINSVYGSHNHQVVYSLINNFLLYSLKTSNK